MQNQNSLLLISAHTLIGLGLSYLHIFHLGNVYEAQTNFHNLTKPEREMLFRGDHALYYSYYRTIAEAPDFFTGVNQLMVDNLTEYPKTINVIQKFHILPEIFIGFLYHHMNYWANVFDVTTVSCIPADDNNYPRCIGIGLPIEFYVECVWWFGGFGLFVLYMYATYLSQNVLGGLAAVAYYFSIHDDATHIHRLPAARDNFAFPFILWQMFYMCDCMYRHSNLLKYRPNMSTYFMSPYTMLRLTILTLMANLCWQFSTYIFATQMVIIFLLCAINKVHMDFLYSHCVALLLASCIQFLILPENNKFIMLVTLAMTFLAFTERDRMTTMEKIRLFYGQNLTFNILQFATISSSLIVSYMLTSEEGVEDVSSIYLDVASAKLRPKRMMTFSTMLYNCRKELSTMDMDTLKRYNRLFLGKFLGGLFVQYLFSWLLKRRVTTINENSLEKIERAKSYLLEDYLEENKISMNDLSNARTDKEIKSCLDLLKKCNFDYDAYKRKKMEKIQLNNDEKNAFLENVKQFKAEISENERHFNGTDGTKSSLEISGESIDSQKTESNNSATENHTEQSDSTETENNPPPTDTVHANANADNSQVIEPKVFVNVSTHYLYTCVQTMTFLLLAGFVWKLKSIATPFMCIIAATFPPRSWFLKTHPYWLVYIFLVVCSIAETGYYNIFNQYHTVPYQDPQLERAIHWINENTNQRTVFAGPTALITTIMLTTKHPIVNHPRMEHKDMKERNRLVYSILSKENSIDIYNNLALLKAEYVIIPFQDCYSIAIDGVCKIGDMMDYIGAHNRLNAPFCTKLFQEANPSFMRAYMNEKYLVLKIFSQSVQLEFKTPTLTEKTM